MIAFPFMLVGPAQQAGILTPPDPENYEPNEFKHWHLFRMVQLGQSMPSPDSHWENAKIIAALPEDDVTTITWEVLKIKGIQV